MKLNQDCVRDVLIYIEENLPYGDELQATDIKISNYTINEILYTVSLLYDENYIKAIQIKGFECNSYIIQSLTMRGHELLDNIRDSKVWKKTKETTSKFASVSLKILSSVASGVLTSMINQSLQM